MYVEVVTSGFCIIQYFNKLRQSIISSQPGEKQAAMVACFESLMDGIDRTLLTKNRDRYALQPIFALKRGQLVDKILMVQAQLLEIY